MSRLSADDIAAMRKQGDLQDYLRSVIANTPVAPKPQPAAPPEPADPGYRIAHPGGWPIGSAASGATPRHGRCTCPQCERAAVVQLPRQADESGSEAA
jgi:hypothetical protein